MFKSKDLKTILIEALEVSYSCWRDPFESHKSDVYICDKNGEFSEPPVKDELFISHKFEKYLSDLGAKTIITKCTSNKEYAFDKCVPVEGGFALVFTDTFGEETGWQLRRLPKPGAIYHVQTVLGETYVCGRNIDLKTERTYNITFVLKQIMVNDKWVHVLADMYPGDPIVRPNLFDLSDGDTITYKDCVERGITDIRWTCSDEQ